MFENALIITNDRFASASPINVFHRESEHYENPHDPSFENRHILFRRRFTLDSVPEHAVLNISADDYYKLWVNGQFVTQGPAPAYNFHYYYNAVDITPYLKAGENVIAVHTFYQGLINRVWVSADMRHMFVCQLDADGKTILHSDTSWKCAEHSGYKALHLIGYATQFAEWYDSRSSEDGFAAPEFDDSAWKTAVPKQNTDYTFFPQPTKQLSIYEIAPARIERTVNPDGSQRIFGDIGFECVGALTLKARGISGTDVVIRCGEECLKDENGQDIDAVRYEMRCNCKYEERWTLSGKTDVLLPYDYKSFRYFELLLPVGCTLSDDGIRMQVRHYPFREAISCPSDDPQIQKIWKLCSDSLKYGAQEGFMDCPTREKGQYMNDGSVSFTAYTLLTGDGALMKKALYEYARSSFISPSLMAVAPCSLMQEIADASMQYPMQMEFLYNHTGDLEMLRDLYPTAATAQESFRRFDRGDGLLDGVDTWNLIDWPKNLRDDYDFPDVRPAAPGAHNVMNAFWYGMCRSLDNIRRILGLPTDEAYTEKVAASYIAEFYDPEQKLFTDTAETKHTSVHSNLLPLFFNLDRLADAAARPVIVSLLREKGLCMGVSMAYYLLAALKKAGEAEAVRELLLSPDGWLNMLREGATTTYEAWGRDKKWNTSLFHPWAVAPILILGE